MSGVIRWEDPSPSAMHQGRPPIYVAVAEQLRANPGKWALIFEGSKGSAASTAWQFRTGQQKAFRPVGEFEFENRASGNSGKVYARYIGGSDVQA